MLQTLEVPYNEGRVCYLTDSSSGCKATVECYGIKKAFRFSYDRKCPLQVGDWVKFRGSTRIKIKKDQEEKNQYYHDPNDGSSKHDWFFFEMLDGVEAQIIASPEILHCLKEAMIHTRRHVDSWTANSGPIQIRETVNALEDAVEILRSFLQKQEILDQDRNAPIAAIEIKV